MIMVGNMRRFSILVLVTAGAVFAQSEVVLCDFEKADDIAQWEITGGTPQLTSESVSSGTHALEIIFDPGARYRPAYMTWRRVRSDWSDFDALQLDVTNPGNLPMPGYILVADQAWVDKGRTYWNRHNASRTFPPGRTTWTIPVHGLYRGEAGSRNNDIKSDIDPRRIVRLDFGFGRRGASGRVIVDNLRLVRAERPRGMFAFDFGPPSQAVMPGWVPISHTSRYTKQRGWGWGPKGGTPWNGADRDTTFGPMLTRDFCENGGYEFHVDLPAGEYSVLVIYENSGYWGGEQAMHGERRIRANGKTLWRETRPDGSAHALYRFENVEPVGADIWDTYMKTELTRPIRFTASAGATGLTLRFEADRTWGSKVSALALYESNDEAASRWLGKQMETLADEFRHAAVCLDPAPSSFAVPPAWKAFGLVAWSVRLEQDITPGTLPTEDTVPPNELDVRGVAVRDEYEPLCLAVRPLRELGNCTLRLKQTAGPATVPANLAVVWYNTSRGFGNIAYHIRPHTLREQDTVQLQTGVTRELILTTHPGRDTPPGEYAWQVEIDSADGRVLLSVPLRLTVHAVRLDRRTDFLMGFYGLMPSRLIPKSQRWTILKKTLDMIREHGMNAVSGGPSWRLTGWRDGKPIIDYGDMDRFFSLLRRHGFTRPLNGYGGARFLGIQDRYEKGRAGPSVEKESGLPYSQAVLRAWRAVDRHARAANWPTILYAMCDETRVRDVAERQLAFMKIMEKVSAAFPRTLRTSGSYSVSFRKRPTDPADMLYWHQRFFEHLDISALNSHDASVMAEAGRLGRTVHIYNQGRTRYSFGLYQWSEYTRGVRARWQWHLNILHGYQFFDLDGREPDTAMLCYGRRGLYPTIHFERCREGAEDFYLLNQLRERVRVGMKSAAPSPTVRKAQAWLTGLSHSVQLDQRRPPNSYDPDRIKREAIRYIEALQGI